MPENPDKPAESESAPTSRCRREELLETLLVNLDDPQHARFVRAYQQGQSVRSAEAELQAVLLEVLNAD